MYIDSLIITGLFGHFDKKIAFKKDCTLLVGINGSGKTTVLKIIDWLLAPSIPELSSTKFDSIDMVFHVGNKKHVVSCYQLEDHLYYKLSVDDKSFDPLVVPLMQDPSMFSTSISWRNHAKHRYERMGPEDNEKELWDYLKTIPNPKFLGVDRSSSRSRKPSEEEMKASHSLRNAAIDEVSDLLQNAFNQSRANVLKRTESFKSRLMLYAFDSLFDIDSLLKKRRKALPSVQQIDTVENRVIKLFESEQISHDDLIRVQEYFDKLKKLRAPVVSQGQSTRDGVINYTLNINQFEKVQAILNDFERFESQKKEETRKIDCFIGILNTFFNDSNKEVYFNPENANLVYKITNEHNEVVESNIDLHYLSSGEQQLLILFANIIFDEPGHIYIIDEPELSLHVKWLEMLYSYLETVFPKEDQLIIATHSPILADKKRDNAVVLYPY